jgi:hypothetical protein
MVASDRCTHRFGMCVKIDRNFIYAGTAAYFQPNLQHRNTADGSQALGNPIRQRPKASPMAGSKQKGLHRFPGLELRVVLPRRLVAGFHNYGEE